MLGIRCRPGPVPVVIVAAHTGVTEGNAATQSPTYEPSWRIRRSAGARPEAIARSSIDGLSASITTSTSFLDGLPLTLGSGVPRTSAPHGGGLTTAATAARAHRSPPAAARRRTAPRAAAP